MLVSVLVVSYNMLDVSFGFDSGSCDMLNVRFGFGLGYMIC